MSDSFFFGDGWFYVFLFLVLDLQVMTDTIENKPQMPEQISRKSDEIEQQQQQQEPGVPSIIQITKLQRERDELK